ncbi:G-protein coupled receptor 54-like [Branchiostoma lanceolatum]|uniref:G-protein coupled receptor 54-like n=1 Tax=Branchiostoma lanceolatum TaxID=7740 RepID=UPI00345605CB
MDEFNSSGAPWTEPDEPVTAAPDWGDPPLGPEATAVPIVFALICVVGLAGNLLVIYVVWKYERMKSVTNYYIVNLAVADVSFLICCVPFSAAGFATTSWHYGPFMCKFVFYFMQVTTMATCLTLAALSIDRYVAIVHPVSSLDRRTPTLAMAISGGIWIGSFLLSVPVAIYTQLVEGFWYGPQVYCQEQWPSQQAELGYNIYTVLISYVIPLLISATSHTLIVCSLYNNSVQPVQNQQNEELALRKKKKVTRMVAVVVTLFAACWLPNHLINLCSQLKLVHLGYDIYCMKIAALCLSYANSAANPFVYGFMGQNFRKSFKKAFPRCFHQNRVAVIPDGARPGGSGSGNANNLHLKPFAQNKVSTVEEQIPSV